MNKPTIYPQPLFKKVKMTTPPEPSPLLQTLHRQGFVTIPSFLSPSELASLRAATANLTSLARAGSWPHIRTVGKQFPPWPSVAPPPEEGGIWGVQHLLHPDLPISAADRAAFIRLYFSPKILGVVHELLQTKASEDQDGDGNGVLVMELLNLLVRPDRPFSLSWHRDDIPPTATAEEELARLTAAAASVSVADSVPKYNHTQWNLPLHDDASLFVVPGSHARARTEFERNADPYADSLPGMVQVRLKAGDIAFYDNDILHRGVYGPETERMTLHGSVSCLGQGGGSTKRARNVLQHGVGAWVDGCDFGGVLREAGLELGGGNEEEDDGKLIKVAEGMRRRLVQMGRENSEVEFSLSG